MESLKTRLDFVFWQSMLLRRTDGKGKDRVQSCEIRGSIFREKLKENGRELSAPVDSFTRNIRRTFCDGLVELARCRSESRTCLMELEPFWKFDRREQQASQPASRSFIPSLHLLAVVFCSYFLFFFAPSESPIFFPRIPLRIRAAFPTLI